MVSACKSDNGGCAQVRIALILEKLDAPGTAYIGLFPDCKAQLRLALARLYFVFAGHIKVHFLGESNSVPSCLIGIDGLSHRVVAAFLTSVFK